MPRLDPRAFDASKSIVMARFNTVGGHALGPGDPIAIVEEPKERGEVTLDTATRLWTNGTFVYAEDARPTPVETPQDAARRLVEIDDLGGGWFLIRAPWLGEGEKVQGKEEAEKRRGELIAAGQPADPASSDPTASATAAQFNLIEAGSNGYYEITGPGLAEPEKVRGKEKAEARLAELQAEALKTPEQPDAEATATSGSTAAASGTAASGEGTAADAELGATGDRGDRTGGGAAGEE